jgi:hypothetical protein
MRRIPKVAIRPNQSAKAADVSRPMISAPVNRLLAGGVQSSSVGFDLGGVLSDDRRSF